MATAIDLAAQPALPTRALLRFYRQQRRDLPWREPGTSPWAVLVSETMLQQTPVSRVIEPFRHWMTHWPVPSALAAADRGDVIRQWGRLGYPRRALRLQDAAAAIVEQFDGVVPAARAELLSLPGVGEYTAGAVAAFAFGARVAVVDTNVRRVIGRVLGGSDEAGPATAADRALMTTQLPSDRARAAELSIAVMEFGAMICTARSPSCDVCPIQRDCHWYAVGRPVAEIKRRTQAWEGTDRQVRGRIMAVVRERVASVPIGQLADLGTAEGQLERCLQSLLMDGLLVTVRAGRVGLPS